MNRYRYSKTKKINFKIFFRLLGLFISLIGFLGIVYIFLPLVSWQIYFAPVFASQVVKAPIPKTTVVSPSTIKSLISTTVNNIKGIDYTDAQTWFPTLKSSEKDNSPKVSMYNMSILKLGIKNAVVSTTDYDLASHLVSYRGTAIPPNNGSAVVFGHSTLPQLFDQNNYKTIFATLYRINVGDEIIINVSNIIYLYRIYNIMVVDPSDTSIFTQNYDNSYLILVTCTPPGTTWKRLIVKARLEKL